MRLTSLFLTTLVIIAVTGTDIFECDLGWHLHGQHCFRLYKVSKSWFDAKDFCLAEDGHLAAISDEGTQQFLVKNLLNIPFQKTWIGLNDLEQKGIYKWTNTNTSLEYTNWHPGEPNSVSEDCVDLFQPIIHTWNDDTCTSRYRSLCQKSARKICGGIYHNSRGNFTTPNHPARYDHGLECRWEINAVRNHIIRLQFDSDFGIEASETGCDYDFVEIFDDVKGQLVSKGKLCGNKPPPVLISYFSKVVVVFHSDIDKNGRGFLLSWDSDHICGNVYHSNHGDFSFPNINATYSHNLSCYWEVYVDPWFYINLQFNGKFDIGQDVLEITGMSSNGSVQFHRIFNSTRPFTQTYATSRLMLTFSSFDGNTGRGFDITWKAVCGETFYSDQGSLASPQYGVEYPPNLDCEWTIVSANDHVIHLVFDTPFEIETTHDNSCGFDHLEVLDSMPNGTLTSKGIFCGQNTPPSIISFSTKMVIRFHSDLDKSGRGFSLSWDHVCGEVFKSNNGNLNSPNYPSSYPSSFECRWKIEVGEGHVIKLSFQPPFSLEDSSKCDADYVELLDYSDKGYLTSKGRWCGDNIPSVQTSTTSRMVLVFHSDERKNAAGFNATWKADQGSLASPNYGLEYPPNLECEWTIVGQNKHALHLVFHTPFEIEATNDDTCGFDHVEVFDAMPNGTLIGKGRYCGHTTPPPFISTSSTIVVRFHSDLDKSGKGFSASWDNACGDTYNRNNGHFTSPHYPNGYPNNIDCRWEIQADKGRLVRISFKSPFSIEDSGKFVSDYIKLYDVSSKGNLQLTGQWTGTKLPPLHVSKTSRMVVVFHSDQSVNGAGFHAVWDSVCGDTFHADVGNVASPGYPSSYPDDLDCKWDIRVTPGRKVRLVFDSIFDLEVNRHGNCGYDYIEVLDYLFNGTVVSNGKWCGLRKPPTILSLSSKVRVLFHADSGKSGRGFNVSWDTVGASGGVYKGSSGHLMSPNYPNNYPENVYCRWEIQPHPGDNIILVFHQPFDLEAGTDCSWDYIEVSRGAANVGRWCSNNQPPPLRSRGENITVIFKSDKGNSGKGFFASWTPS